MTTEHEMNAPETITLRQLLRYQGASPLQAARLLAFIVGWQECSQTLGRDPLQAEYAEFSGQSTSTVERHFAELREVVGVPLPNFFPNVVPRLDPQDEFVGDVLRGITKMYVEIDAA
jgi:hypothetical protein